MRDRILVEEGSSQAARIRVDQWVINGKFNSKAAYEFFRPRKVSLTWPNLVWHSSIIPRHSFIMWLGLKERLQTKDKLHEFIDDKVCPLCDATDESIDHLFFQCDIGKHVWFLIKQWLKITRAMSTLKSATKWLIKEARGTGIQSKAKKVALACTVYHIWEARNKRIFEGVIKQPDAIVRQIQMQVYRVMFNL